MPGIYGRQNTGAALGSGTTDTNATNVRASVFDPVSQHCWAYRWGMRIGTEAGGTIQVRGHLWNTTNGNPDALLASTAQIAQSQAYTYSTPPYADLAADLTSIVKLTAGQAYGVGDASTGPARHGMIPAASVGSGHNTLLYQRSTSGTGPYGPMAYSVSSNEGWLDAYVLYDANVAPNVPGSLSPSGQTINQTPAFTGTFRDANETVGGRDNTANEKLKQFHIQLRAVGSQTLMWDTTYNAPADQQTARAFSSAYGGSGSLTPGTTYEWRAQVSDQFNAWSLWSGWTSFSINPGGSLSTPTGGGRRISRTPTTFPTTWTHVAGLSQDAYNPQILQGGLVVRDFGTILSGTLANGTTYDVLGQLSDWTNTGTAQLDWGTAYTLRARGRDTSGVWSPFSGQLAFTTNYPPTTPVPTAPASGTVSSTRPLLQFTMSDADNTPANGLAASVRIKNSAGAVLFTRAATNVGGNAWQYQTTATDLATYAQYRWDAVGTDGVLTTIYSPERTFTYAEGPVITVTAPASGQIVTGTTVPFAYTVANQQSRSTRIYAAGSGTPLIITGTNTTTSLSGAIDLTSLPNNADYELTVTVTNTSGLTAESPRVPFRLQYPPAPTITGVTASPERAAGDREPSVVRVAWNQSTLVSGFAGYDVYRTPAVGGDTVRMTPAGISSITQTAWIDPEPANETNYVYGVVQHQAIGVSTVDSVAATSGTVRVSFHAVIISDADDPGRRVVLPYVRDAERGFADDRALQTPWSGGPPVALTGGATSRTVRATYALIEDPDGQLAAIQDLAGVLSDDAPPLLVYRNRTGLRLEGTIVGLSARERRNWIDAQFGFQELRSEVTS